MTVLKFSMTSIAALYGFIYIRYRIRLRRDKKALQRLKLLQKRHEEVYAFYTMVEKLYGEKAYDKLPPYSEMLCDDTVELKVRNYIKVEDIINMN